MPDINKALELANEVLNYTNIDLLKGMGYAPANPQATGEQAEELARALIEQQARLERYKAALEECLYNATDFAIDDETANERVVAIINKALAGSK